MIRVKRLSSAAGMPTPIDGKTFRFACGKFATGITITTVRAADGTPQGMTANSFTSLSLHPPLVSVAVSHRISIHRHFRDAKFFGVNILREGQKEISDRFASRVHNRFERIPWAPTANGVPRLAGVLGFLECHLWMLVETGDHTLVIGEVVDAEAAEGEPLLFYGSDYCGVRQLKP
jgi:flavin reductase (DIM6/NTAB) family NADH-FMN oxidoreductase RutF